MRAVFSTPLCTWVWLCSLASSMDTDAHMAGGRLAPTWNRTQRIPRLLALTRRRPLHVAAASPRRDCEDEEPRMSRMGTGRGAAFWKSSPVSLQAAPAVVDECPHLRQGTFRAGRCSSSDWRDVAYSTKTRALSARRAASEVTMRNKQPRPASPLAGSGTAAITGALN